MSLERSRCMPLRTLRIKVGGTTTGDSYNFSSKSKPSEKCILLLRNTAVSCNKRITSQNNSISSSADSTPSVRREISHKMHPCLMSLPLKPTTLTSLHPTSSNKMALKSLTLPTSAIADRGPFRIRAEWRKSHQKEYQPGK